MIYDVYYLYRSYRGSLSIPGTVASYIATSTYIWKVKRNIFSILIKFELSVKTKKEYVLQKLSLLYSLRERKKNRKQQTKKKKFMHIPHPIIGNKISFR